MIQNVLKLKKLIILALLSCLMIYNQDLFLPQIFEILSFPPSVIYMSGRIGSGIDNCNKFLEKFVNELSAIESEITQGFQLVQGKTSFFDPQNMKYLLYDFYCFNNLLSQCYRKNYLFSILNKNNLYAVFYEMLDEIVENPEKKFVFLNFFFKALRKSRIRKNIFDSDKLRNEFNIHYLYFLFDDGYDNHDLLKKFLDVLLKAKLTLLRNDFILEFSSGFELEELINLSFDTPRLGNIEENITCLTSYDFDFASDFQKKMIFKENDFIFHYILAAHSNYVVLDSQINNIYVQRLEKKHKFYKFL